MKKHNKNILAYVRPNNHMHNYESYITSSGLNSPNHQTLCKSVSASKNIPKGYKYQNRKQHQTQLGNSGIYHQIVEHMEPQYYQYLNKLIDKTNKQERKTNKIVKNNNLDKMQQKTIEKQVSGWDQDCQNQKQRNIDTAEFFAQQPREYKNQRQKNLNSVKMLNCHERTKSYADIVINTPKTSKDHGKIIQDNQTKQNFQMFYSGQTTPKAQKSSTEKRQSYKNSRKDPQNKQFLSCLDNYIHDLSLQQTQQKFFLNKTNKLMQRRTISKDNHNNIQNRSQYNTNKTNKGQPTTNMQSNSNILERLEETCKQVKSLKIKNQAFQKENYDLKKKNKKMKNKMKDMLEHMKYLTSEAEQERFQRKRMEQFFQEIQGKIMAIRPQRKTIGRMQTIEEYYCSESTEQDEDGQFSNNGMQFDIVNFHNFNSKNIKKSNAPRKSIPRQHFRGAYHSNKGNNYGKSWTKEQISKIIAQKYNHEYDQMEMQDSEDCSQQLL